MNRTDKLNCWEFKKCGRERMGSDEGDLCVCPATVAVKANGIHGGKNAGRICWAIAGTLCDGSIQGDYALKINSCIECDFYKLVQKEEMKIVDNEIDLT